METTAIKSHLLPFNPQIISHSHRAVNTIRASTNHGKLFPRSTRKCFPIISAVLSGPKDVEVSSPQFQGFSVTTFDHNQPGELKISVEVFGSLTQTIFDKVFEKMVADAQPIPGFRRVKGGKTPDIPKHILLEVLGHSRVLRQVIKKVINSTISEYVDKEGLKVRKDLSVEQPFEDLESTFEAGQTFNFNAVLKLQETS